MKRTSFKAISIFILSVVLSGCILSPARQNAKTDFGPFPENYQQILARYLAYHGGNRLLRATKPTKMKLTVQQFVGGGVFYGWKSHVCYTPNTVTYTGTRCQDMLINSGEVIETYNWELKSFPRVR